MKKMFLTFLFAFAVLHCSDEGDDGRRIDLDPFIELARSATCSDDSNRLFLIDDQLVFWDKRGNCPDNSYSFMLFMETPDSVLCLRRDSFGGPVGECPHDYTDLFSTIIDHLDKPDLGLGHGHVVEEIPF